MHSDLTVAADLLFFEDQYLCILLGGHPHDSESSLQAFVRQTDEQGQQNLAYPAHYNFHYCMICVCWRSPRRKWRKGEQPLRGLKEPVLLMRHWTVIGILP
jgi:hypothetical protein